MPIFGSRLNGEHVTAIVNLDSRPFGQARVIKSLSVEPKVVEHDDDTLGSDASDPDQQIRGWTAKFASFVVDSALGKALLAREAKRAARQAFEVISITIAVKKRDGTTDGYILQECEIPPVGFDFSGATERVMQSFTVRAKYFRTVTL